MKTIIQDLKLKEYKNLYLLYGEELYLRDQYAGKLRDALISPEDTVNLTLYEGKDIPVPEIIDQAETMPFFSDRRLIMVKGSGFFKSAAQEAADLADYLEQLPETTTIIFVEDAVDKRSKMYKVVNSRGHVGLYERQDEDTILKWIRNIFKRENKEMTQAAYVLFRQKTGSDMNNIYTELEKLLCYTMDRKVVTEEDVEEICTEQIENKIFDMIRALSNQQQKKALELYYDLLALKEAPMKILALITRQMNQLLTISDLRNRGEDTKTIASLMKLHPKVISGLCSTLRHYTDEKLRNCVELAVQMEEDVKTGKMPDRLAVELVILELSRVAEIEQSG